MRVGGCIFNLYAHGRVHVFCLDVLIDLQGLVLLVLSFENLASLEQEVGRLGHAEAVGSLGVGHGGSLLEAVYGLVVVLQVGIDIAEGGHGSGAYHLVVARRVVLDGGGCLLPLLQVSIAESGIEVGQIACLGAAVL